MDETIVQIAEVFFGLFVFFMYGVAIAGVWFSYQVKTSDWKKSRAYTVNTFWVLVVAAVSLFLVGCVRHFAMDLPSWGYFFFAAMFSVESYSFNDKIKILWGK